MRIIAGLRKGLVLHSFDLDFIRPTKDIVKEFIFNVLANVVDISTTHVCDLFAGTGAIGLEALSRGARSAVFVDHHAKAVELIRRNVHKAGFDAVSEIIQTDVDEYLSRPGPVFDLIFADAPYAFQVGHFLVEKVGGGGYLRPKGFLIIECSPKHDLANPGDAWRLHRSKRWGESQVHVLQFLGCNLKVQSGV